MKPISNCNLLLALITRNTFTAIWINVAPVHSVTVLATSVFFLWWKIGRWAAWSYLFNNCRRNNFLNDLFNYPSFITWVSAMFLHYNLLYHSTTDWVSVLIKLLWTTHHRHWIAKLIKLLRHARLHSHWLLHLHSSSDRISVLIDLSWHHTWLHTWLHTGLHRITIVVKLLWLLHHLLLHHRISILIELLLLHPNGVSKLVKLLLHW